MLIFAIRPNESELIVIILMNTNDEKEKATF